MTILNVRLKALLSFIKNKHDARTTFIQHSDGVGWIATISDDGKDTFFNRSNILISWVNEDEREIKLMEYIFLNRI